MTDREGPTTQDQEFDRPWEEEEEGADVVPLPGMRDGDDKPRLPEETDESDDEVGSGAPDWEAMARGSDHVEDYTSEEYVAATTEEYEGLAEEVSRAAEAQWEQQAVAATMPGVESGLVGFGDVSGRVTVSEEDYEAAEQAASADLTMRVGSALVVFGLFVGSLLLGGWWFSAFITLVMVVSVGELYATLRTVGYKPLALFGILGVVFMGVGAHNWGAAAIGGWAMAAAAAVIVFFSLTTRANPTENTSVTVLGMAWAGLLSFAILLAAGPQPVAYIFFVVLVVAFNDIGGYFVGRSFGRRPMAPLVSPRKTVEGFIGGLISGAVVATVLATFPAWETIGVAKALVIAGVVGLAAPLGDLVESMVKRSLGVKDMGSVLPGHGGMLDRIDAFLFSVPVLYFVFRAFGLL
ncbi:MAG: phosphatidate cytidylyltransferase [Actinobacteria bacterium]|nr:phosphatidate cytidylyltransferase [Actinomycetota bacterium]